MAGIFEEITPGIFQADRDGALEVCGGDRWKEHRIGGVITCAAELSPRYHPELQHLKLEMLDEMLVPPEWFDQAVLFQKKLSSQNLKTVIHCMGGINRSSIVILACMISWGSGLHQALNKLPRKPWGAPTMASLMSWAKTRTV